MVQMVKLQKVNKYYHLDKEDKVDIQPEMTFFREDSTIDWLRT